MSELPSGTVTFLFTDLEGSTRLWQQHPGVMRDALARHDQILREAIAAHGGHVVKTTGDGAHAVFAQAHDAVDAAVIAQLALEAATWEATGPLKVRMGIHSGTAEQREGDYYGTTVNRAARIMSVAHGGQILVSLATEELVRDTPVELLDLGEHRLRDLGRPERLFQVTHANLPREFGALRTLDALPGNLPLQVSSFVGREREIDRTVAALGDARAVTLTGVGGVGKTRLALQVAAEVLPQFRDGAWLCELGAVRDPAGVVDAVARVFRVTARPGLSLEESLVAYLHDQELLLVLDNCEHLLRPAADVVVAIEAACVGVRVLATSREGLSIDGEQLLTVPSLRLPDDEPGVGFAGECEAVQLFAERARAVKVDFAVDDANRSEVVAVCTRLDGMALAIELAAARIPAMSPAELALRLDRRFRLLSGGNRVAIERHQTLRATIDWSYELLTQPEQRLLARLSVFAGGWTLDAVEAVCAGEQIEVDDAFELLARLVVQHLVVADAGPETRYRLLETIRQYGEHRLEEAGETDMLRARHVDYYGEFASLTTRNIFGPGQVEWGTRLALERDNLHAAMAFALETQDLERGMRLLCAVPGLGAQINNLVVFDPMPVLALAGARDHPGCVRAFMDSAFGAAAGGDLDLALELADRALDAQDRLGPYPGQHLDVDVSQLRSVVAESQGALAAAADHRLTASLQARAASQPGLEAVLLAASASTLAFIDPDTAAARATEALKLARRTGMPTAKAMSSLALAQALAPSDPDRSAQLLRDAENVTYENQNEILFTIFASGVLADWPLTLRAASRLLNIDRRSGTISLLYLAGILNLAARGLADHQPEAAAVIQGAVRGLLRRAAPAAPLPALAAQPVGPDRLAELVTRARSDTTQLIVERLGDPRMRELRAQGETLDRDQACAYARTQIDDYLMQSARTVN